ncbi:MAG: DUF4380 domain-containing protein [Verrucomicrobiales bacterium]|nr:DUF4380 domain-containing protein [Verrucomicrobiales bacterium]
MSPPHPASRLRNALGVSLLMLAIGQRSPAQQKGAERLSEFTRPTSDRVPMPPSHPLPPSEAPIQIKIGPYLGWERSITIQNSKVEALIVPAIGRVLHFRLHGESSPFWDDPSLRGKSPDPSSSEWGNFGGDKTWPSPQADWGKITPRAWPPPVAFDSLPVDAGVRRDAVVLRSPVDPHYGIRTERVIRLAPDSTSMTITTTYEKVEGHPVKVGVWIITQLEEPVAVFAPVPTQSAYPDGFNRQSGEDLPANLKVERGLLSLTRDLQKATKIGMDADQLLWVGPTHMLHIESPRIAGAEYPDQGSSAEIYTNPDPKTYVELEMLGPLQTLGIGDRLSQTNTYTLLRRKHPDPQIDARRILRR